jgi:thioredoxin reductase (NADPH)
MAEVEKVNCLIVGSGPAGYTAAVYAARANLNPVLYQGLEPGGQLMITTDVENYPGYPDGVMGPQMMEDFKKQAERMGADIRFGLVTNVDFSGKPPYRVEIDNGKHEIEAQSVILSTGAVAKWLGLESEQRLNGHGVSACAVCDGFFYRGQEVAIVGGGDTACEEALYLSKLCSTVHMFVRRDEMRASKIMQDRVFQAANIKLYWNTETEEVIGDKEVEAVRVFNNQTGEKTEIPVKGFFVAIGHKPMSALFKDYLDLDEEGYVITKPDSTATKVEGVFAAGDLQDKIYRQAVTAAGTGCMAALEAERYLSAKGVV